MSTWKAFLPRALAATCVIFGASLASADTPAPTGQASLRLDFVGLESDSGVVVVALFDSERAFDGPAEPARKARLPIANRSAEVTFRDLPAGDYAVRAFHDENQNGEVDTNFVGIPKEAVGFSNDAMGRFGPPSFEAAKFRVDSESLELTVKLKEL